MHSSLATKLQALANASPTMMAAWDRDLRCRFANPAYRTWFGVEPSTLPGMSIEALLGERLFALNQPFMRAALDGRCQEFERVIAGPDGVRRHSLARYTPDYERERVDGFFAEVVDISAYKAIEHALIERVADLEQETNYLQYLRKRRGHPDGSIDDVRLRSRDPASTSAALTAQIAHELRNAISPLNNCLQVLARDDLEQARVARASQLMQRQMALATRLLDDMIDLSGIEAGVLSMRKQNADLREVIEEAVAMSAPDVDAGKHELKLDVPDRPLILMCDPQRLAQAVCNLLNNACKYSPAGGCITVSATSIASQVQISVTDDGVGIPANALLEVFDLFAQLPHTFESRKGGIGIGLSLVRKIATLHGGTVVAASAGIGKGACFTISLPVAPLH